MKRSASRKPSPAITLRGLDPALLRRIDALAREVGISRTRAAVRLLEAGAGIRPRRRRPHVIGHALDRFFGTWTAAEAREFEKNIAPFGEIDPELWK